MPRGRFGARGVRGNMLSGRLGLARGLALMGGVAADSVAAAAAANPVGALAVAIGALYAGTSMAVDRIMAPSARRPYTYEPDSVKSPPLKIRPLPTIPDYFPPIADVPANVPRLTYNEEVPVRPKRGRGAGIPDPPIDTPRDFGANRRWADGLQARMIVDPTIRSVRYRKGRPGRFMKGRRTSSRSKRLSRYRKFRHARFS